MTQRSYRDYVIKDGRLIGRFEEMYRESEEIPWHQDESAYWLFSDVTLAIMHHFPMSYPCELGCGLGYFTYRIFSELKNHSGKVLGMDISECAIAKARELHRGPLFEAMDILDADRLISLRSHIEDVDFLLLKEVVWYIVDKKEQLKENILKYFPGIRYMVSQSFPDTDSFYGSNIFPDAMALKNWLDTFLKCEYFAIEVDHSYGGRELLYYVGVAR